MAWLLAGMGEVVEGGVEVNLIVMIAYNGLELTKQAVKSALAQDVDALHVKVINNGSTDGTKEWLDGQVKIYRQLSARHLRRNISPTQIANGEINATFDFDGEGHILAIPNDVILPPNLYTEMLRWPRGFVTASMTGTALYPTVYYGQAISENTPMAVVLIRRWAYMALVAKDGYFLDEGFFHYASDNDLALRMAACGIRGVQLENQYWHYSSATLKLAPREEHLAMCQQADKDREYFEKKWGFKVTDPKYGEMARDINFRG